MTHALTWANKERIRGYAASKLSLGSAQAAATAAAAGYKTRGTDTAVACTFEHTSMPHPTSHPTERSQKSCLFLLGVATLLSLGLSHSHHAQAHWLATLANHP
jgi:hypothetical protein